MIGMFSSIIPVAISVNKSAPFKNFLSQVIQELRLAFRHRVTSFEEINRRLCLHKYGRHQVFDISFSLNEFPCDCNFGDVIPKVRKIYSRYERWPLAIYLNDYHKNGNASIGFSYNKALFSDQDVRLIARRMNRIINVVLDEEESILVSQLPMMSRYEEQQVLRCFNQTEAEYPKEALIHELFEQQVERTPDAVAVRYEGEQLSYAELNARANQLAHRLRAMRDASGAPVIKPDERVAICVERSLEMVVGLLGILKAGAAYVPVDPEYPQDRIAYVLQDAGARIVLTQRRLLALLQGTGTVPEGDGDNGYARTLLLDDEGVYAGQPTTNIAKAETGQTSQHLAYVIYTSGSTGQPKGVMNEHRGVVNRLLWMQREYALTTQDRVLQKTAFSFDVSVWEFFWTLQTGAILVMARPGGHQNPAYLEQIIEEGSVTTLHFVPSMLQAFVDYLQDTKLFGL